MRALLTDVSLRALKVPSSGQYTVWDKASPIGIRVSAGGAKTYIVLIGSGRRRTLGKVGIISLAEARAEARRVLAEKTLGLTKPKVSSVSFSSATSLFLEQNYRGKRPRTKHEVERLLTKHFIPVFGKKPVAEITDGDVGGVLSKLARVPSEQLHAFRAVRAMLKWCTRPPRRYIAHSPLEGYEPPGEDRKGTRVLSDKELARIWHAATGAYGGLFRLLILWGTRNGETARIKRAWLDDGVLTIPGEVTKNGRAHVIPLLPLARSVLSDQKGAGPYFFPGKDSDAHFNDGSWGKLKSELDRVSGVKNWQLRDIRRTFRTNMAKLKVSREVAEVLLNHVTGANRNDLDEIYNKYDFLDEKRAALAKWEARLRQILKEKQ
ncbi:MAG: site-specific integrase [Rhizobiales bacterium]|nr:site-specific integrase [Hyphomicrobiales bacterium]